MEKHKNKCVVVTGGLSGIGAAITNKFLRESARLCVIDINSVSSTNANFAKDIEFFLQGDVADIEAMKVAFKHIASRWGSIDILVNNAGISIREPFASTSIENWNRVLAVNLTGTFIVTRLGMDLLNHSDKGSIINIASVSGMVGMPDYASYNVSKAGIIELTKTLALELSPNIRVNCICPGYVLTPMQQQEYSPEAIESCAAKIPLKRLGLPDEIAELACYLASTEAGFITGQSFVIDGGETAGGLASH